MVVIIRCVLEPECDGIDKWIGARGMEDSAQATQTQAQGVIQDGWANV